MHPRTEVIHSGKVRVLDVTESLTYQGTPIVPGATDKVKISTNDTTSGFLNGKLVAGTGIALTENNDGGNETLTVSANVVTTDELTKVSSNDTTSGYLNGKLVAGTGITLTENNNGGNETLSVAVGSIDAGVITTGTVDTARLGSGTANSTTFLRGDQTWATPAGGVTGFTGSQNVAAPNNTVNASRLLVDAVSTNADAVIEPKGTGALLAQLPDGTTTGGNKRGAKSIDLQTLRNNATQVASGVYCLAIGGGNNTAAGAYSTAVGYSNTANGNDAHAFGSGNRSTRNNAISVGISNNNDGYGTAVFGASNTITALYSHADVVVGKSNTVSDASGVNAYGNSNNISGAYSYTYGGSNTVSGSSTFGAMSYTYGGNNTVSGSSTFVVGMSNTATGANSWIFGNSCNGAGSFSLANGYQSATTTYGQRTWANGRFAATGDCQQEQYVLRRITTDATTTELSCDGAAPAAATRIGIASDATYTFHGIITGRRTDVDNESAGWEIKGVIDNNAGTTAAVGTFTVTSLGASAGASTWVVAVTADNTNDSLKIEVTGETGKTIRWAAYVNLMKVLG